MSGTIGISRLARAQTFSFTPVARTTQRLPHGYCLSPCIRQHRLQRVITLEGYDKHVGLILSTNTRSISTSSVALKRRPQTILNKMATKRDPQKASASSTSQKATKALSGSASIEHPTYITTPSISAKEMVKAIESSRYGSAAKLTPSWTQSIPESSESSELSGSMPAGSLGVDPFVKAVDPFANQLEAAIEASKRIADIPHEKAIGTTKMVGVDSARIPDVQAKYLLGPARWESVMAKNVKIKNVTPRNRPKIATLEHGLDRVLFNPGVHWLQDPRSMVYNFDPYLRSICQPEDFDYDALPAYKTSSLDPTLYKMALSHKAKYTGSTSSMTTILSQFYFLISGWKPLKTSHLSEAFKSQPKGFTRLSRAPATIQLVYKGKGVYAIDADKTFDSSTVLMQLGKSMEKMLTSTPEEFARFTKANSWQVTKEEREQPEAFNYIAVDKFLLRSQLDCEDPRLPGKTFDLKTRAAVAIRLDVHNYELNQGYQLNKLHGYLESFEREYYDMMRSAFLKYSLQVRIGQMDGIFVAFHNTARVFGFQYISLDEMDSRLFGTSVMGDECFKNQLRLLNRTLDEITAKYPHQDLKITVDTDETIQTMNVWVETMPLGAASSPNGQNAEVTFDEDGILEMQPGAELSLWQIVCYSDINGVPTVGPFELSGRAADKWELRYKIAELKKPHMMNEYRRMKAIQAEILSDDEEREFAVAAAAAASAGRKIDNIEGIGLENKRERVASKRDQMRAMLRRISEQGRVKQENEERHQADKEFLVWEPKGYTKIKNLPMSSPVAVSEQPLPKKEESEDVVQSKVQSSSQPFIKKPEDEVVIEPSPTSTATILSAPSPPRQESIAARLVRRLRESESASTTDSLSEITMDAPSSTIPAAYYRRGYDSKLIKLAIKDLLLLQKSMSGRLEDKEEQKMLDIIKERHSWLVTSLNPFDEIRLKLLQIPPNFEEFGQLDREHLLRISRLFGQPTYLRTDLLTDYSLRRNLMRVTPKFRYRLHLDYFHNWIHKVATQKGDAQPFKSINDYLSLDDEDALMRTAHGLNITNKMITTHELAQGLDRKNAIKKAVLTQIFYAEKAFTDAELQAIGFYPRIFDADTFKTSRDILRGIGRNYKDISQLPRWDSPKETVSE